MKKFLFLSVLLNAVIVKFDTQDNIFKKAFGNDWVHQEDEPNEPVNQYSLKRIDYKGGDALRVRTEEPTKRVFLNLYPYSYKVKKISNTEFIITSKKFQKYFDNTDVIQAIFFK